VVRVWAISRWNVVGGKGPYHVQVVDHYDHALPDGGAEKTLPSLVQFSVDQVLRDVGAGFRGETHEVRRSVQRFVL
jgi:hypothetical protein